MQVAKRHTMVVRRYKTSSHNFLQHMASIWHFTLITSQAVILTHVVNTLAAAFSKWKLRTLRMLSAYNVRTYNSPPFREMTSRSYEMKDACAPSRLSFTPSCTSGNNVM